MLMMLRDNNKDARNAIPGFEEATVVKPKRQKRSGIASDDPAKVLNFKSSANPLSLSEQKTKTRALLSSNPEKMVYFSHEKDDRNRCARIMFNNMFQSSLCADADIIAIAEHNINLICNDPDPAKRQAFVELQFSGYTFFDKLAGDYDVNCVTWYSDEVFYKGALHKVDISNKEEFMQLYKDFSHSARNQHGTSRSLYLPCTLTDGSDACVCRTVLVQWGGPWTHWSNSCLFTM